MAESKKKAFLLREDSYRTFLIALAATVRGYEKASRPLFRESFQKDFLEILDRFLSDFGPGQPEYQRERWADICSIRDSLQYVLEDQRMILFDPSDGPPH